MNNGRKVRYKSVQRNWLEGCVIYLVWRKRRLSKMYLCLSPCFWLKINKGKETFDWRTFYFVGYFFTSHFACLLYTYIWYLQAYQILALIDICSRKLLHRVCWYFHFQGVADRVCLGLLPSSECSWVTAVRALR